MPFQRYFPRKKCVGTDISMPRKNVLHQFLRPKWRRSQSESVCQCYIEMYSNRSLMKLYSPTKCWLQSFPSTLHTKRNTAVTNPSFLSRFSRKKKSPSRPLACTKRRSFIPVALFKCATRALGTAHLSFRGIVYSNLSTGAFPLHLVRGSVWLSGKK